MWDQIRRRSTTLPFAILVLLILTIYSGPRPVTMAQTASGLVAAYSFDQGTGTTLTDTSGYNNNGAISGAAWHAQGKFGAALSFDGINDVVTIADAASLDLTAGMTLEAWVLPTALTGWRSVILKERPGHLAYALYANTNGNRPSGEITTTSNQETRGTAQLGLNTWTHVAVTYDAAMLRLYINGTQAASRSVSGTIVTSSGALRIGGNSIWGEYFTGLIDEVRIFNGALTQADIQRDMNAPVSNAPRLNITQPANGSTFAGTTVNVTYTASGDLTEADHVHFRLDSNPEKMDLSFDGSYQFLDVPPGPHVLAGYLARADHSKISGSDASSVSFTTTTSSDTEGPSVSMTSPQSGSTVSGTISVSADASDNVGVTGVQFLLDGANLGAEDTTMPYSTQWNTSGATGSHSLSARARDAAGNQTVSSPVSVTVEQTSGAAQVGQWTGVLPWPLVAVHAILLPTGEVLAWDHAGGSTAHLWNPVTGAFTSVPNSDNLFCSGHAYLSDGRPMVVGGEVSPFVGIPDVNIFDPLTRAWSAAAPMGFARWYPTATTLPDGRLLVVAGTQDCSTCNVEIPEVYDPATNTWAQLANARLSLPTYPFMIVQPDGKVLSAGANVASIPTRTLDVYAQTWTTVDSTPVDGGSAAMYLPGKIVKSGTSSPEFADNPAHPTTYVLDMTQVLPLWRQTASMAFPRAHHNLTLLPDGTVLATGGGRITSMSDGSQGVFEAELWSPATESWTTMAPMQVPRLYHSTALLLPDGRVVTAGGEPGTRQHNAQIYSPPYLFKGARPTISAAPATIQHGIPFFVETPDASGIASASLIRPGSVTHGFNMDQRFLPLSFQPVTGGLELQAPAHANLAPPGSYMLFIVNTAGVPSVASFVRLTDDATPPAVSITAPADGATVSGTVTVSADASDNVGVGGVQFLVDGIALGENDTTAPYAVSWNTAGISNGAHTVSAVARDRAGNQASSSVTVNVSNTSTVPAGLIAAYSFDEGSGTTLSDAAGNHHGSVSGATWTSGRFGSALSFDGINDWVTVADASLLDLTTGMTLEAWVYPAVSSGWRTVLLKEQSSHLAYALYGSTDTNRPSGEIFTTSNQDVRGTTALPPNVWNHIAATYDGSALRLYVNGTQVAVRSVSGNIAVSAGALRIGGNSIWQEFFQGKLDEIRIYDRALTATQVQSDMGTPVKP